MKPSFILFGVSVGTVVLRSILIAWVFAAEAGRVGVVSSTYGSKEMFPELLSVAFVAASCGVIAAWFHIWRAGLPTWIRVVQMVVVLLLAFGAFAVVVDPSILQG